jgi:RNA-binding protein YhbY
MTDNLILEILKKAAEKERQKLVVFSDDRESSKKLLQDLIAKILCPITFRLRDGNCVELSNKTIILFREEEWKKTSSYSYQVWDEVFDNKKELDIEEKIRRLEA